MTIRTQPKPVKSLQPMARYILPESWNNGIGILRDKRIDPLRYQKQIRKVWPERAKRQAKLAKNDH